VASRIHRTDTTQEYPREISVDEPIWVRVSFQLKSQNVTKQKGIYCWTVEGFTETDVSERGIESAKMLFQIEEYLSGLKRLQKSLDTQNIGFKFWKVAAVTRYLSEAYYLTRLINHELSRIVIRHKLPSEPDGTIDDLRNSLEETSSMIERKKGQVQAVSQRNSFYIFILGNIIGLIEALVFQFVL